MTGQTKRSIVLKKILNQTLVYLLAALVIFFDQYTKHLVRVNLALNESWSPFPWLAPYTRILHISFYRIAIINSSLFW